MIPQRPSKSPKLSAKPDVKQPLQILALTMIDPSTNLLELIVVLDKESRTVARAFDRSWLCCYPRPLISRPWSNITAEYWRIWYNIHILLQNDRQHNITAILEQASNIIAISETYYNNIYYWSTTCHH
jgi:hypothetical protein